MTNKILIAWSAGLSILFIMACYHMVRRLHEVWGEIELRLRVFYFGVLLICLGLSIYTGDATYRWLFGHWTGTETTISFTWRAIATVGLIFAGGAAAYSRCQHKGWLMMVLTFVATYSATFYLV